MARPAAISARQMTTLLNFCSRGVWHLAGVNQRDSSRLASETTRRMHSFAMIRDGLCSALLQQIATGLNRPCLVEAPPSATPLWG
jgi:hypothetical protein